MVEYAAPSDKTVIASTLCAEAKQLNIYSMHGQA